MFVPAPAYPRPDFDRSHSWLSLDGEWDFAPDPHDVGLRECWQQDRGSCLWGHIVVPFAWETDASGLSRQWMPVGWYRREIQADPAWAGQRVVLHVGAAHYASMVWVNGMQVGEHVGGYHPFALDITDALAHGEGTLVLRIEAPVDKHSIPHGKQRSLPPDDYDDCAFTASSGIWQPVWLEARPATYVQGVALRPSAGLSAIQVQIALAGPNLAGAMLHLQVEGESAVVLPVDGRAEVTCELPVRSPQLWSPASPRLYEVQVSLASADGDDRVRSYTGLRSLRIEGAHLYLNGERLYLRGALDQGYWPGTGYTAPDDAALRRDVELALRAGFNLVRKHIKLENPRWLYWADRLGLLVWEEPPCVGRYSPVAIAAFEAQLAPMVARDGNHPSIVLWGIYNEEWGLDWRSGEDAELQAAVARAYDLLAVLDSSRPIVDDSGWWHVKTDIVDWHYYDHDMARWRATTAALASDRSTSYGHGLGTDRWYDTRLTVPGSDLRGQPLMNGEFGGGRDLAEQGWLVRWQTADLRRHDAFCGYVYTELYDVEHEHVGLFTAQRELKPFRFDPATIHAETVLIFDHIPERPGADYLATQGEVAVTVLVSHHGESPISGRISWTWDDKEPLASCPLTVAPFAVSTPLELRCPLPPGCWTATLQVWLEDERQRRRAEAYLDVVKQPG